MLKFWFHSEFISHQIGKKKLFFVIQFIHIIQLLRLLKFHIFQKIKLQSKLKQFIYQINQDLVDIKHTIYYYNISKIIRLKMLNEQLYQKKIFNNIYNKLDEQNQPKEKIEFFKNMRNENFELFNNTFIDNNSGQIFKIRCY